jgi:Fe2+ or Zn2+ uptake regulation protein
MKAYAEYPVELRKRGLKATPLRLALLEYLSNSELPIDVSSCIAYLQIKHVSFDQVTVYRNLETFVAKGFAKKVDLQNGKYYFEKVSDCSHLICEQCGKIEHVHVEKSHEIAHEIVENTGFQITQHVSDFFGKCKACRTTSS